MKGNGKKDVRFEMMRLRKFAISSIREEKRGTGPSDQVREKEELNKRELQEGKTYLFKMGGTSGVMLTSNLIEY